MNDEQILSRGGDEEDITSYAHSNGACMGDCECDDCDLTTITHEEFIEQMSKERPEFKKEYEKELKRLKDKRNRP